MSSTISQATLDLINQAESSLAEALMSDQTVASAQQSLAAAQLQLAAAQSTAAQLHSKATQDGMAALAALKIELQLPDGGSGPAPDGSAPALARMFNANVKQHGLIQEALGAGLPWQKILQLLMSGGFQLLQQVLQAVLSGSGGLGGILGGILTGGGQTPAPPNAPPATPSARKY